MRGAAQPRSWMQELLRRIQNGSVTAMHKELFGSSVGDFYLAVFTQRQVLT